MAHETNYNIRFLQAAGIVMVVLGHIGYPSFFPNSPFSFYSFHMALFIFISGFLYKDIYDNKSPFAYAIKKAKSLLIPFYICLLFQGMLTNILLEANLIGFGQKMTLENFFCFPMDLRS